MPSDLQITNIRDQANANSAITIGSDGQITVNQNNPTIQLGANTTFPSGHVIQTVSDTYAATSATTITTTSNDYLGADLQVTITPKATGNKLLVTAFIDGIYNNATSARALHNGFAFDANFSSGNGTTLGTRASIVDYEGYFPSSLGFITNIQFSTVVTVGTNAPSTGSASIIRPIFQAINGDMQIAGNSSSGFGVMTLSAMEIQA